MENNNESSIIITKNRDNSLGILGIVFGSVGLLTSIIFGIGIFPAVAGLVLSIIYIVKGNRKKLGIVSLSISSIAVVFSIVMVIGFIIETPAIIREEMYLIHQSNQEIIYQNTTEEENRYLNEMTYIYDSITADLDSFLKEFKSGVIKKEGMLSTSLKLCDDLSALNPPPQYIEIQEKNKKYAAELKEGIQILIEGLNKNDNKTMDKGTLKIDKANNEIKKEVQYLTNKILHDNE